MAQMELIINYLDALIKKKTSLWIYEGLLGGKDKEAFSDSLIWMRVRLGRSRKGGYRIIFQEALKLKLGFIWRKRGLQWRKWKGIQGNRILGPAKCISKNQWFSREPLGASELIPFTWKLVSPMGWDGKRAGLWNIGLTDTEGFISKESLWVESWMTRGKGSVSVSEQCGSEGITSLLFLFGECFKTSAFFSNTNMCPSWVTHLLQFLISGTSSDSWLSLHEGLSQWQVIFDRFEKPGKENKLFSSH